VQYLYTYFNTKIGRGVGDLLAPDMCLNVEKLQYVNLLQMIHQTINFVAITTLNLAFVTFTMDIYSTYAAIWNQTETTIDWQDQFTDTVYQQMAATETPESFTNMSSTINNQLNVSLENPALSFSNYNGTCRDFLDSTHVTSMLIPKVDELLPELITATWDMSLKFDRLMTTAVVFFCFGQKTVGHDVISMARKYVHNFTEFMGRINSSAAAIGEVAVLDTVADLYRPSIQQVESVMEVVKNLTDMILEEDKMYEMHESIFQSIFNTSSEWETIVEKQKKLVNLLQNISERAGNISEHTDRNPFINVITSGSIWRFLDAQYWAKILEEQTQGLVYYQTKLRDVQQEDFVEYTVVPVIVAIVFVVGMASNGLLLTIFVRHKETRTLANSMLINLTVVDFLSLVVNVLLDYLLAMQPWPLGWFGCKLFVFFYYLLIAVSTYSVAMISVQRFVVLWQLPSLAWCHQSQKTKYVLLATVWGIGCIVSVPHGIMYGTDSEIEDCYSVSIEYRVPVYTSNLIVFCVVPLLITAIFSGLTAYRIRRSAREIPGEPTGQEQLQHSRMVSSTVLFALTVLFVVSNVPFFLFLFLIYVEDINMTSWTVDLVNAVSYSLRFLNCCLNPVVLLVMIKRYREYIKSYCGKGRYSQQ